MKQKYILMYKNDEVLSFLATFGKKNKIEIIDKLEHFDKAPYGINENNNDAENNRILFKFFNARTLSSNRCDYQKIIDATGCYDDFELSFKGHGLSLSNHYWYKKENEDLKYEDINFFTNKWDDSFARCILKGNYESLKNVSLNVPDIVTAGWAIKGWLCEDDGPTLYKLGIAEGHYEECLSEVLTSRLARRILNKDEVVEYKLSQINERYASASKVMIGIDEEMVPLSEFLSFELYTLFRNRNGNRENSKKFFETIKEFGLPNLYQFFVKLMCLRSLCFVNDLHFNNISIIRNLNTGNIRIAPIYDLASSFGSSRSGRAFLSNLNKGSYFLVYFIYGCLEPDWDYSWYNPDSLIGFEDEIKETLSKSDFYTVELIDNIIDVYQHQKASLDEMRNKQINKV